MTPQNFCPGGLHNKLTILLCSNICSYSTRGHLSVGVREGRTRVRRMWTARRPSWVDTCIPAGDSCSWELQHMSCAAGKIW